MSIFDAVAESGALEPIDLRLASLIRRLAASASADIMALSAALLSHQRSRGHSCIALPDWAGRPFPTDSGMVMPRLPNLRTWEKQLAGSTLVSGGGKPTPLVRDASSRLYLRRYWRAEQSLANSLRDRLETAPPEVDTKTLAPLFRRLFTEPEGTPPGSQAVAAATALASRVTLISGGPGTGKTTTVGRVLALLLAAYPESRVALAAPTGKAAARLGEAVAEQSQRLLTDDNPARFPKAASTLHRLLGYQPRHDRFRHHAGRPLALDLLIIDEVSMVDLLLMDATIRALPAHARVILLGDKDQLTSVETGSVFGDLCAAADLTGSASEHFAELYRTLSGYRLPDRSPATRDPTTDASTSRLLRNAAVELTTSYRFRDQPGIGELAAAVRKGNTRRALATLDDPRHDDVGRLDPSEDTAAMLAPVLDPLKVYLEADSPAQALERLGRFRVLCARRRGPWGVERLNTAIERYLATAGHPISEGFYHARPILITANDYQTRLFNGDLGICWTVAPEARSGPITPAAGQGPVPPAAGSGPIAGKTNPPGRLWAFFPGPGEEPRRLPLARLPAHETAWAMTVHKSQGSEFDRVLLMLGDNDSRVLTRDLIYTGATRARHSVVVVATPDVIRGAVARRSRRVSGLADALRGTPAEPPPPVSSPEPETFDEPNSPDDGEAVQLSLFG